MSGGSVLIKGRTETDRAVEAVELTDTKAIKAALVDEDGEVIGDGTPLKVNLIDEGGDTLGGTNPAKVSIQDVADLTFTIDNTGTHTFHNAANAAADGTPYTVAGMKTLVVEITGATVTTSTILFKAAGATGAYISLNGVRVTDLTVATSSSTVFSATPELWIFDVAGLTSVMMDLSTLTGEGATVTVTGKARG